MENIFEVAHTLVEHIQNQCPEDIAVIAYYGSYADGTATKRSDLDFFFIPATTVGYQASLQFVLDGISFDFWPISWERAERMATFEEPKTTIIANSKLLYVRSDEDQARFMALREKTRLESQQGMKLIGKAEAEVRDAYVHLHKMNQWQDSTPIGAYRMEAYEVLTKLLQSLALLNRTYLTKGWGKNQEQIMQLALKPAQLEPLMKQIMTAASPIELRAACGQLAQEIVALLSDQRAAYRQPASYAERLPGFYEEIKGVLDKVLTACENRDYDLAFFAAAGAQAEIAHALYFGEHGFWPGLSEDVHMSYNKLGLPDLVALLDPDNYMPLYEAVERLIQFLVSHLKANGVVINQFDGIVQLKQFLQHKAGLSDVQ
ncbi:nucleotidyltransferase domain-containing protein [Paenibacillus luteus]|uniref:nucleotidyltransferase domain-containing protein n=1 Tax=Paenibacillus luteus TaxID=2545753 RepID=UPI001F4F716F|nr:nucleotidyltransferase domain-containing protein [Paenibacillus luteus]